ncbi:hypothetical protein RZS08_60860, partial [Arthrospira platensis SPKY1]|nr:hypothetical protein [Arthrospira platensis SPKY1]
QGAKKVAEWLYDAIEAELKKVNVTHEEVEIENSNENTLKDKVKSLPKDSTTKPSKIPVI